MHLKYQTSLLARQDPRKRKSPRLTQVRPRHPLPPPSRRDSGGRLALLAGVTLLLGLALILLGRPARAGYQPPADPPAAPAALRPLSYAAPAPVVSPADSPDPADATRREVLAPVVGEASEEPARKIARVSDVPPEVSPEAPVWIRKGLDYLGTRYTWGGDRPEKGFDCSGFIQYVLASRGVSFPRTAREQYEATAPIGRGELAPGDLLFFSTYAPGPSHVGIYLGEGKFLHASSAARRITINRLDDYRAKFIGARRIEET